MIKGTQKVLSVDGSIINESNKRKTNATSENENETKKPVSTNSEEWHLQDSISPIIKLFSPTVRDSTQIIDIKADLFTEGFAVIANVLSAAEISQFETSFWAAISAREPAIKQHDMSTWTPENCEWRGTYNAGQYKHYGMSQEDHCWLIRKNNNIRQIFEGINGEPCCVSLDGAAALFHAYQSKLELHVDLVPGLPGFEFGSIQGSFNVHEVKVDNDTHRAGAGFVCVPRSHKLFDDIWTTRVNKKGFKLPKKHWQVLEKDSALQLETVLVVTPPNCLILWDSKLLHRNYGGDFTPQELNRVCRLTQFICWQPKRLRTLAVLDKKVRNVLSGKSGNHWACLGFTEPIK